VHRYSYTVAQAIAGGAFSIDHDLIFVPGFDGEDEAGLARCGILISLVSHWGQGENRSLTVAAPIRTAALEFRPGGDAGKMREA
jgi:hypothetical protein